MYILWLWMPSLASILPLPSHLDGHPLAGDVIRPPSDGEVTPVGERASVKGVDMTKEDEGSDHMDHPLPPVEEIFFPEGGFRAWSVVFGVSHGHLDDHCLSLYIVVTIDTLVVGFIDILKVRFL
jgi:hypothetical protein